jgi:hypothetical protein
MPRRKTTANEPIDAVDPGGTRPAPTQRTSDRAHSRKDKKKPADQAVKSGDRNVMPRKEG